ncbi:MAG: hypothetical protein ACE5K0_06495 [Candidatus Methanofastidiosia archaeon]
MDFRIEKIRKGLTLALILLALLSFSLSLLTLYFSGYEKILSSEKTSYSEERYTEEITTYKTEVYFEEEEREFSVTKEAEVPIELSEYDSSLSSNTIVLARNKMRFPPGGEDYTEYILKIPPPYFIRVEGSFDGEEEDSITFLIDYYRDEDKCCVPRRRLYEIDFNQDFEDIILVDMDGAEVFQFETIIMNSKGIVTFSLKLEFFRLEEGEFKEKRMVMVQKEREVPYTEEIEIVREIPHKKTIEMKIHPYSYLERFSKPLLIMSIFFSVLAFLSAFLPRGDEMT